jgi:FecR protein
MRSTGSVRVSFLALTFFLGFLGGAVPTFADSSHARVIRLSLVQGDVRFSRNVHGDPLADSSATWEAAPLNLPISQGYVVATDDGRAEVEFENGAMAFLSEKSILEFYDLSLKDGAFTTRLVLRQGTASFYVNPNRDDYFSVTGGDFTVAAASRTTFRLNNFDDGSNVDVISGRVSVVHQDDTTWVEKGNSLSMKAGDPAVNIGRMPDDDDFDHWVSGRVDSVSTATNATLQYTSSPYYASGFADLYNYGSWSSCGGYGFGWRPFGAGLGWSPFSSGQWAWDPNFGWTWISAQPWGWAPYHYGGWLFDSGCGGWFYSPPVFLLRPGPRRPHVPIVHPPRVFYRSATAVFVRQNGVVGIVPAHPLDRQGKTPLNLEHGVLPVSAGGATEKIGPGVAGQKWETVKSLPRETLKSNLAAAAPPPRVARSIASENTGSRVVLPGRDSSITYDSRTHSYVNTNAPAGNAASEKTQPATSNADQMPGTVGGGSVASGPMAPGGPPNRVVAGPVTRVVPGGTERAGSPDRNATPPAAARATPPAAAPARNMTPPPAPRPSGGGSSGARGWGGSSGGSSGAGSSHSSAPSHSGSASHSSGGHH